MSAYVPLPAVGSSGPWGRVEGKMGVVSFVHRTAIISISLSVAKCDSIYRAQSRPAHILVQNRQDRPRGFYRLGQKVRKNFEFFTISRLYVISETIKNRGIYAAYGKKLYLSPIQMSHVFGPSVTAFYGVSQKVSDVIPVLRITPRATEPSTVSVFLSVVKCVSVCRAQTCAHSGIKPFRLAKGFPQGGPKSSKKFEFLTIS